jgi:hypothetical protein
MTDDVGAAVLHAACPRRQVARKLAASVKLLATPNQCNLIRYEEKMSV